MNSIHNPARPKTPPAQTASEDFDMEAFSPRDVTDIPWRNRTDSTPMSMISQSTLSSSPDSPIHAALIDNHEPVIRDSWPTPVRQMRGRGDSLVTDRDVEVQFDPPTKPLLPRNDAPSPIDTNPEAHSSRNSTSTPTQSTLFQKMRAIFENPAGANESGASSPTRSRPVSGVFHPVRRVKTLDSNSPGYDVPDHVRKESSPNELEDEIDEQSALLQSSAGEIDTN
jgi:hypothetical protein